MIKRNLVSEGFPLFYINRFDLVFRPAKVCFLAVIPFLVFCSCKRQGPTHREAIIGHWGSLNLSIEYTTDSCYNIFLNGAPLIYSNTGQLKYSLVCHPSGNHCLTSIYGVKEKLETREKLIVEGDVLFSIGYKSLKGIEHHIDEIACYKRCPGNTPGNFDEVKLDSSASKVSKYYLPSDLRGAIYVAYSESDAGSISLDEKGNRLITVPISGLFMTSDEPWPLRFAKRRFEAYRIDSTVQDTVPVDWIFNHELSALNRDSTSRARYDLNALYLIPWGYNQIARSSLHERIDRRVSGNVESFRIDTLKNLMQWRIGK